LGKSLSGLVRGEGSLFRLALVQLLSAGLICVLAGSCIRIWRTYWATNIQSRAVSLRTGLYSTRWLLVTVLRQPHRFDPHIYSS
jgi:hypothetical protein